MTGKELKKICEKYPDFEFQFSYTHPYKKGDRFLNIDTYGISGIDDIGHSDKIIVLSGEII